MYFPYKSNHSNKRKQNFLLFGLSLLITVTSGMFFFRTTLLSQLSSMLISFGLDPLRSQLLAALLMTMSTAFVGAALSRFASGTLIGSIIIFYLNYLSIFIQLELRPSYDPGGLLEPLVRGTLVHTIFIMLALACLSAFFGMVSGVALGKVLLDPPYRLARLFWQSFFSQDNGTPSGWYTPYQSLSSDRTIIQEGIGWIKAILFACVLLLISQSGPLFLFSPDVGIHTQPADITNIREKSKPTNNLKGVLKQDSLISLSLNMQRRSFMLYLPPSYNTDAGKEKRYPTLYLLHGLPGGEHDWFTGGKVDQSANTLIETQQISEVILVVPDGNGQSYADSEWGNSYDQSQLMETFVAVDLVRYVDLHYRTIPDLAHRAIGGLSMGGFGAMNIALHYPNVFGTVVSLGGYYQAEGTLWGKNTAYIQNNSPEYMLLHTPQAWNLHIYLGAATKDQPYYDDTRQFMQELASLHMTYQFDLQTGYHSWSVWQAQIYHALLWIKWV